MQEKPKKEPQPVKNSGEISFEEIQANVNDFDWILDHWLEIGMVGQQYLIGANGGFDFALRISEAAVAVALSKRS